MASSSKRSTRLESLKQRSKTFRTVIYPDQDKIEICPDFKSVWLNELYQHPWAMLIHPSGKKAMLELKIENRDSYMTNGKSAALLYGLNQPTEVNFHYGIENNSFTLSVVKDNAVIDLSSADEDDDVYISDTEDYTLWEHDNDRVFSWEVPISHAYAADKKDQVLHVPAKTAESVLRGKQSIFIRTLHNMDKTKCTLKTYERKVRGKIKKEMFLTDGWYKFKKANNLQFGDKLKCQLSDPPEVLVIEIVRTNTSIQQA